MYSYIQQFDYIQPKVFPSLGIIAKEVHWHLSKKNFLQCKQNSPRDDWLKLFKEVTEKGSPNIDVQVPV